MPRCRVNALARALLERFNASVQIVLSFVHGIIQFGT